MASRSLLAGGLGSFLAGLLASRAGADTPLDIQILQTASSLETLAVSTYESVLQLPFVKAGSPALVKFVETTIGQHKDHRTAFQAQTRTLGGREQREPNSKYKAVVDRELPASRGPVDVVGVAEMLESIATATYLENTTQLEDTASKRVMASVMAVEAQHAAVLRIVKALMTGGAGDRFDIPTEPARLSAATGSVALPHPLEPTPPDMIADPRSGALG